MHNRGTVRLFCPANICTALRFVLLPALMCILADERFLIGFVLILLIGLSDLLDGWLARRLNSAGLFGAISDVCTDCAVIFALQGYLLARGDWPAYLLVAGLVSVGSFGICAACKGSLAKNSLGQYTGAVLLVAFAVLAVSRAPQPALWEEILRIAGPLLAAYLLLSVLKNLAAVLRRWQQA